MARCSCGELRATQSAGAVRTPLQEHQPPCVIRNGDPAHAWCIRLRRRGVMGGHRTAAGGRPTRLCSQTR